MSEKEENQEMQEQVSDVPTSIIYYADCLSVLQKMPDESVDMIYLDPPFDQKTNKAYGIIPRTLQEEDVFKDLFKNADVGYVNQWLAARLWECKRVLKPTGSIFLHLNDNLVFDAKLLMDVIFGKRNFKNAIVWKKKPFGRAKKYFMRKHDTILFYAKDGTKNLFIPQRIPYGDWGATNDGSSSIGQKDGKRKTFARDIDEGRLLDDCWIDISDQLEKDERTGYNTQKRDELLMRIIKATTNEGDIVLDPVAGSGTTGVVAEKLSRRWILVDASDEAIRVMEERCKKENIPFTSKPLGERPTEVHEALEEIDDDPTTAEKEVCRRLGFHHTGKTGDHGLDGRLNETGLQVKKWGNEVGESCIRDFIGSLVLANLKEGIFVATSFSKPAKEAVVKFEARGFKIGLETFKHLGLAFNNIKG